MYVDCNFKVINFVHKTLVKNVRCAPITGLMTGCVEKIHLLLDRAYIN